MALITRISRLFRADIHAVLDRIEEPEALLRQAVREMEETLARDEQHGTALAHEHGQLGSRATELEQSLKDIEDELDICFGSGNDDLARAWVRRKLEVQRYCQGLARKRTALGETLENLNTRLRENRARLENMRQKAELLGGESARARPADDWSLSDITVRDEDVEVAFLREQQQRSRS